MRKYIFILCCSCPLSLSAQSASTVIPQNNTPTDTARQTDLIDIAKSLFHIRSRKIRARPEKKIYFSVLPVSGAVPGGTGNALITSTTAGTYLGSRHNTYLSTATFAPYWNLKGRFGLPLRTGIWLPGNTWTIQGDTRFLVYPQYTWGLGETHQANEKMLLDYRYIRFYQSAFRRIRPYFFAGAGYHLDYRFSISSDNPGENLKEFSGYEYGTGRNSFSSGVSLNLLYDTRNNAINPLPGSYVNLVFRMNPTFLGSNNSWESLYFDVRKYVALNPTRTSRQNTLAFWSFLWAALGEGTPYLDLPSTGWDPYNRSARGIDQNRYRGKTLLYFESEYRRDITNNGLLGFVVFANVNTVNGSGNGFSTLHPAGGAGLRVKFNKRSQTNITVDYGFSSGYSKLIIGLGEAF